MQLLYPTQHVVFLSQSKQFWFYLTNIVDIIHQILLSFLGMLKYPTQHVVSRGWLLDDIDVAQFRSLVAR